jgi:hypothetical protein
VVTIYVLELDPMAKLTLSADPQVIRQARRLARKNHTSISAMFSRYVRAMTVWDDPKPLSLGPVGRQLKGIVKLPEGKTYRQLIEEALEEKYGQ